ncbi:MULTISPECIES: PAQR family membrane homeostasis protein TrhA [unclassified Kribbella]|uniref:PAQR family membrane homeostasis protein TrhA n=1 Tax=unclassified Kribbella TaxID=2644121 RepID=UPI003018AFCF
MPDNQLHNLTDALSDAVAPLKPLLRGWLHAGTFPVAVAAGVVLIVAAPSATPRIAAVVFTIASSLLFGVSALYHRGHWRPAPAAVLRRMDHSNIFVMIAGTYTPFGVLLLTGADRVALLVAVWGGALLGVLFRVFWLTAPRWLYTPIYLALGWAAVFWMPDFYRLGGAAVVILLAAGGLMYSAGAVVYALKKPNPSPRWFGFHEMFHACTVAAFIAHYIAVSLITYNVTLPVS